MVKEDENQGLKRIRFEEEEDEDRISKLPDCLLVEILSRLPLTKDAIRTGTLSKRWKHIWTSVSNLIFEHPLKLSRPNPDYSSFVDKTLSQRPQSNLNKFQLHTYYYYYYNDNNINNHSRINNWIRYAVTCNVQHLHLTLCGVHGRHDFPLDEFVFISSCFTHLSLSGCAFNPTGAISWKNLRNLSIAYVKLDEDLIENVLSGSPLLETLVLDYCYGYRRLNITSKSVKNLVFSGYNNFSYALIDPSDIFEINAPNILTLKLQASLALRKLLLLNVSSLVEADLDCMKTSWLFKGHSEEDEEEMLKGFILNLLHVKDLKIGTSCVEVFARLKAKGFNFPSNLKVLDVTSSPNGSAGCDQENWMIFLCSTVL